MQRTSQSPGIGTSGTSKRSCENCSKAKAKCIWEGGSTGSCGRYVMLFTFEVCVYLKKLMGLREVLADVKIDVFV
jgi:hypothetical protein